MTEYLTLTEFVPGTKAKAQEVNANFAALKDAVNSKAVKNGDATQVFNIADASANTHAVTKKQLEQQATDLTLEIKKAGAKFCARSGNTTNGKGDLFSYTGLNITPKIGGTYANLVIADYKGALTTISTAAVLSMTGKANATYNIFITPSGTLYVSSNALYKQTTRPTMVDGDVWFDTSKNPFNCIKYTNSSDVEFLDVPLGKVVITGGVISSLETSAFNQNGYDINMSTFGQSLSSSGWTKLPNGLFIQWGYNLATTSATTYSFPIAFPNACFSVIPGNITNPGSDAASGAGVVSASQFSLSRKTAQQTLFWLAVGY